MCVAIEFCDLIVIWQLAGFTPEEVCEKIRLCTDSSLFSMGMYKGQSDSKEGGLECAFCEFVLQEVERLLDNKTDAADVEKVLDEICDDLPSHLNVSVGIYNRWNSFLIVSRIHSARISFRRTTRCWFNTSLKECHLKKFVQLLNCVTTTLQLLSKKMNLMMYLWTCKKDNLAQV